MPSIGQTRVLVSIGAVVEMGVLSTLKQLLMEYNLTGNAPIINVAEYNHQTTWSSEKLGY
jgi:hypothetical protein